MNNLDQIIEENHDNLAFVLGNGINRKIVEDYKEWNSILESLWKDYKVGNNFPKDISLPEICDVLFESRDTLHECFCQKLNYDSEIKNCELLRKLKNSNIPILTTNYDLNIEKSLGIGTDAHFCGTGKSYRWNRYFGDEKLYSPTDGFGVWHVHGDINHQKTICISQLEYVTRIKGAYSMKNVINNPSSKQYSTLSNRFEQSWLKLFFCKSLCIAGLRLGRDEIFLRWLLFIRKKYQEANEISSKGWYVYVKSKKDEEMTEGMLAFLQAVGIEPVELESFDEIYN